MGDKKHAESYAKKLKKYLNWKDGNRIAKNKDH